MDSLQSSFNKCITIYVFPSYLNKSGITQIYKYRPVSLLPNISKTVEKPLFIQISSFWKVFHAQHCLAAMFEKWKFYAIFVIILKVIWLERYLLTNQKHFDSLLIAKIQTYGFNCMSEARIQLRKGKKANNQDRYFL